MGNNNILIGYQSGLNNTIGHTNTAIGTLSLSSNIDGNYNTATGYMALGSNQNGVDNVANGDYALSFNVSGFQNSAFGSASLRNNIGNGNSAFGAYALFYNTIGNQNSAFGSLALNNNTNGTSNVGIGGYALNNNTNGSLNTAIGTNSLDSNTTGNKNSAIGNHSLSSNTIGRFNCAFGNDAFFSLNNLDNTTCIGYSSGGVVNASNRIEIGNTSVNWIGGQVAWSTYSDERIKDNIQEDVPGLAFITRLRPVTYNLNIHRQNDLIKKNNYKDSDWDKKYDIEKIRMTGFLAQEVGKAAQEIGYDFSGIEKPKYTNELYSLRYSEFTVPLVKAVQELNAKNEELEKQIVFLKSEMEQLKMNQSNKK